MTRRRKKPLRSKTIWFGIILAALSALQGFVVAINIDPLQQAIIGFALSAIIIILRFVTNEPIEE